MRLSPHRVFMKIIANNVTTAIEQVTAYDRDPAPYFFDQEVQKLLQILTRPIPEKVFRPRMNGVNITTPEYRFMTNEELEIARKESEIKMWDLLQIPPIVKIREEDIRILSKDPAIQGYTDAKHVFTDITFGVSNKYRLIVVREPNGILRTVTHTERDRLNQIYFPIPGREIEMPKMFEEEHLKLILDREDYEFILDRACVQFNPDNSEYHRVTQRTYDEVNKKQKYDKLRSTRHYGSMIFYLAWSKNLNNLLLENIETGKIEDGALAIKLYYILNVKQKENLKNNDVDIIEDFIKNETNMNSKLVKALENYKQISEAREKLQSNIEKIHQNAEINN
ncbi:PREDICTED: 28S ribosomal protein S22, mitochondrial [Ceratosolen solmsi marchali]|uniref:28S ribosomal protein S22, mitochondrial n=1 Tax=Ceratosolen solmsi marchali TaxID=326594 RepID=A0AAJ6YCS7_9HYME|nr:PREDICTED: 28S ribosomal protein S22, mitochondrial [Ceratosolen solmsi marchali]